MVSQYLQPKEHPTNVKIRFAAFICISAILLCSSCNSAFLGDSSAPITAILGAFDQEVVMLEEQLADKQEQKIEGIRFVTGRFKGRAVVIARTGIGKVNAAMTTTLLIEHFRPNEVIFTGIAGAINPQLLPGDIVIAEKTAQHDLGTLTPAGLENEGVPNPVNGKQNPVFFPADQRLLKLAQRAAEQMELETNRMGERVPRIIKGVVVTGDIFAASTDRRTELRKRLGADATEMEGAAAAQICYQQEVPYIVIRGISDRADERAQEDVYKFLKMAAKNSAGLVAEMVGCLHSEFSAEMSAKRR
ncbi:MAG: 5'-methylthioadenosine/adenosylhomocysteine nucleosidase [Planctomycetota bacterium]|jgi:adenosylhomocysteine nucleosidase